MVALALHPAERRRIAERMPAMHDHEVVLRPLGGGSGAAAIVGASEQDFIGAVLADLERPDWRGALEARRALRRGSDRVLELTQPVHRRFYLVLYEALCRQPGGPRVDPRKLDGMGLVLRRRDGNNWSGWMTDGPRRRGWLRVTDELADPDPARRRRKRPGAAGQIDALLDARRGGVHLTEQVMPLFAAPVELCQKLGRTVLYGLVPVSSGERNEEATPAPNYANLPAAERAEMVKHLSEFLKQHARNDLPHANSVLDSAQNPLNLPTGVDGQFRSLGVFLQQLMVELDAFGTGPAAVELMRLLRSISLPTVKDAQGRVLATIPAGDFAAAAARILIAGEGNPGNLRMPLEWPAVSATLGAQLTDAALACLSERHAAVVPLRAKFDGDFRLYSVRAYIRVEGPEGCPAKLAWSDYSDRFRVLPWWDGDGPATKISLPDITDFKRLKPNVSFELPPSLANLLSGDMKKLSDGEKTGGTNLDIFWLCSFSLPIITLCAFIVLNIFLSLFNIFFFWMAFIKICIPIPIPRQE